MRKRLAIALGTLLLCACGSKTVYDQEHTFSHNVWNRFTPEVFEIEVGNIDNYYDIDFTASVDTAVYRYDVLPVMVILNSPTGEQRQFYGTIPLKERGHWRGKADGSYRQATGRIRNYFSFNSKGTHRMEVSQRTSQYDLEGVQSLAVTITKAKLDYKM